MRGRTEIQAWQRTFSRAIVLHQVEVSCRSAPSPVRKCFDVVRWDLGLSSAWVQPWKKVDASNRTVADSANEHMFSRSLPRGSPMHTAKPTHIQNSSRVLRAALALAAIAICLVVRSQAQSESILFSLGGGLDGRHPRGGVISTRPVIFTAPAPTAGISPGART
jgi:hypothetical protein